MGNARLIAGIIVGVIALGCGLLGILLIAITGEMTEEEIIRDQTSFQKVGDNIYEVSVDDDELYSDTDVKIVSMRATEIDFNLQVRSPSNSLVMNDTDRTPYRDTVDTFTTLVSGDYVFRIRFITANVTMNDVVIELIYEDISGGVASACGGLTFLIMAFILIIISIPLIISHFVGGDKADDKAKIRPTSEIVDVNIGPTPPPQQQMRVVQQPMGYPPQGMPPQQPPQQGRYPPQGMPPQQAGQPPQYGYGGVGPQG